MRKLDVKTVLNIYFSIYLYLLLLKSKQCKLSLVYMMFLEISFFNRILS